VRQKRAFEAMMTMKKDRTWPGGPGTQPKERGEAEVNTTA